MNLYRVADAYVEFLYGFDARVYFNKSHLRQRPYVGIVLEVGAHRYVAPLTSYKEKHDRFRSSDPRWFKVHEKGKPANSLALVAFCNMLPVLDSVISRIDFALQPEPYRRLLTLELEFLQGQQDLLRKRAAKLHELITVRKHSYYAPFCCDFSLLELRYREFESAGQGSRLDS